MTRAPTLAAVNAVEMRLFQSKRNVRQSVDRTRAALRTATTRPSTLALVAVGSGISAFWVARRCRASAESLPVGAGVETRASGRVLVRAFISLYGAQVLAFVLQHGAAAWKQRASRVNSSVPRTTATGDRATTVHDVPVPSVALAERQSIPQQS